MDFLLFCITGIWILFLPTVTQSKVCPCIIIQMVPCVCKLYEYDYSDAFYNEQWIIHQQHRDLVYTEYHFVVIKNAYRP